MSSSSQRPVLLDQLVALNDEIAALVRAGVPIEAGLSEFAADRAGEAGQIGARLAEHMAAGASLSEALDQEQGRLPEVYRAVVKAGARAGRLPAALEAVSTCARELLELRRQIGLALLYPLIVCLLAYGLFVTFLVDMLARFRETYSVFHLPVHGALAPLVWLADRVAWWWYWPPLLLLGAVVYWFSSRRAGELGRVGGLRFIPGMGRLARDFRYASFADLLALLIDHEIALPEALRLAGEASGNVQIRRGADNLAATVERGGTIADAGYRESGFPPFLHWVLAQASRGSRPVGLLRHAASVYRRRAYGLLRWIKVTFPMLAAAVIGGGATALCALALFGPLTTFWKDLLLE